MPRYGFLLLWLIMSATMAGCALPGATVPELLATTPDEPYLLGAGDRLRIIVFGQDALSNSYTVDGSGHISMPLIGLVPALGRTTQDLQHEIAAKLRNGFVRDPHVSVEVEAYRPFYVLGEVINAGQYPYVEGLTAQKAIAIAGGFSPRGYQDAVDLTRDMGGVSVTGRVPLLQAVRPGDTLTVRERIF
ncbi:polysaccharide biosynthesis/export family protein [Methylosinus trichosporium]|uniref:Sugar transporter n=2 Tax=Methylosinus TaxID=425 RepID=A0A2D2CX02_METT3|nr:sugar transporter [Methylosinus trichosporium OB3b]OBS52583.1 sugar transporter [Methylosinus sp. 3S-1]